MIIQQRCIPTGTPTTCALVLVIVLWTGATMLPAISCAPVNATGKRADASATAPTTVKAKSSPSHVRGVWAVTKVAFLFGPTLAIYLYDRAHDLYEQYQPYLSAAIIDFTQHLQAAVQSPYNNKPLIWLSSMPEPKSSNGNAHVTTIANEIIRLTNVRLREHAVVSRLQMDDDQYEFSRTLSAAHVRSTALHVMHNVLTKGSGRYLQPEEKIAVHALIASSVY